MIAWLVQNAIVVVPLAVGVAIVCRLLRPAPAVCHALWLLVLLKLVVPPLPVWEAAWLGRWLGDRPAVAPQPVAVSARASPPRGTIRARVTDVVVVQRQEAVTAELSGEAVESSSREAMDDAARAIQPASEHVPNRAIAPAAPWAIARYVLLLLWAAGALVTVVCHVRHVMRLRRALKSATPAPLSFSRELGVQCRQIDVRLPQVRVCTGLPCPMVIALPRAMLLWPTGLEHRLDAAGVRAVLLHELAHLKRRDHLTAWLEVAVACLWWWHPVVWWARRELREYAELSCDAWVVAQLPEERTRYAKALVDVCEFISLAKPASAPAVGMARGNRRSFDRRLHMILRQRVAARMPLLTWIGTLAAAVMMLPGFSTGQESHGTAPDSPVKSLDEAPPSDKDASTSAAPATPTAVDEVWKSLPPTYRIGPLDVLQIDIEGEQPDQQINNVLFVVAPAGYVDLGAVYGKVNVAGLSFDEARDAVKAHLRRTLEDPRVSLTLAESSALPTEQLRFGINNLKEWRGKDQRILQQLIDGSVPILSQHFKRFHDKGAGAENVVRAAFAWILQREASEVERQSWSQYIDMTEDAIEQLIVRLLNSHEFSHAESGGVTGQPKSDLAAKRMPVLPMFQKLRTKQAKVQTLLRVIYDMPSDKAEVLAKFLNDNVKGEIEARTEEEGLVVTAEAGIQRTVAGIVSLMTGEPVTLDLGDTPPAMSRHRFPTYMQPGAMTDSKNYSVPPQAAQLAPPGVYLPPPAANGELRTRTVIETDPTTGKLVPRTVLEERVVADEPAESRDPSSPRLHTPQPTKERTKEPATATPAEVKEP